MTEYQLLVVICLADVCSSILLFVEYFWGRSDTDMKREAKSKRKLREKYRFEVLNVGEGK